MIFLRCLLCRGGDVVTRVTVGSDPCTRSNATNKQTWGSSKTCRYPRLNIILIQKKVKICTLRFLVYCKQNAFNRWGWSWWWLRKSYTHQFWLWYLQINSFSSFYWQIKQANFFCFENSECWYKKEEDCIYFKSNRSEKGGNITKSTNYTNLCFYK